MAALAAFWKELSGPYGQPGTSGGAGEPTKGNRRHHEKPASSHAYYSPAMFRENSEAALSGALRQPRKSRDRLRARHTDANREDGDDHLRGDRGGRRRVRAGLHGTETRRRARRSGSPRHTATSVERSPTPRARSRTPHGGAPTEQRRPPQARREMCATSRARRGTSAPPSLAPHGHEPGEDDSAQEEEEDGELPEEEEVSSEHSSSEGEYSLSRTHSRSSTPVSVRAEQDEDGSAATLQKILLHADAFLCGTETQKSSSHGPKPIRFYANRGEKRKKHVSILHPFIGCYARGRSTPDEMVTSKELRALSNAHDSEVYNLGHNPDMDQAVASLMYSPEEARRQPLLCPDLKLRPLEAYLKKAYDVNCIIAHMINTTTVLSYAMTKAYAEGEERLIKDYDEAMKAALAFSATTLGRMSNVLIMARRKLWLQQSNMSEEMQRTLLKLPSYVKDTTLFGPGAQVALDDLQADMETQRTRKQLGMGRKTLRKHPYDRPSTYKPSTHTVRASRSAGWRAPGSPRQHRPRVASGTQDVKFRSFRKPKGRPPKPDTGKNRKSGGTSGSGSRD